MSILDGVFYSPSKENHLGELKIHRKEYFLPVGDNKIHVWLLEPQDEHKGTIVQVHGNGFNITSHVTHVDWLVSKGYQVLLFDYRGYGQSTGKPSRKNTIADTKIALREAEKISKGRPLIIIGQSLGGAVSIAALAELDINVSHLVLDCTFSSYRRIASIKLKGMLGPLRKAATVLSRYLISNSYEPYDYVNRISKNTSILIMHGEEDTTIPVAESKALYEIIKRDNKDLWIFPKYGHTEAFRDESGDFRTKFIEYLDG